MGIDCAAAPSLALKTISRIMDRAKTDTIPAITSLPAVFRRSAGTAVIFGLRRLIGLGMAGTYVSLGFLAC